MPALNATINFSKLENGDFQSIKATALPTKAKLKNCIDSTGKPNFAKGKTKRYQSIGCPSILVAANKSKKFTSRTRHQT